MEVTEGKVYRVRLHGTFTNVRLDSIVKHSPIGYRRSVTRYICTNLTTNRAVVIKSTVKFIREITDNA